MNEVTTSTMEVRVLAPTEGMYLTQTNLEEGADRTYSTKVFLAQDASESDWRIASKEEKTEYDRQRDSDIKEQ